MLFKRKTNSLGGITSTNKEINASKKGGALKETIAKLARGLMLPISILPIAGLFLGIGSAITSQTTNSAGQLVGTIIMTPGSIVYALLPLFFAIAISITFTNDSGSAALSSLLGYAVFVVIQSSIIFTPKGNYQYYHYLWYKFDEKTFDSLFTDVMGIKTLSTNIFGGMVIGGVVAYLFNKYKAIQLPKWIGFFSGVRFVPIVVFFTCTIIGLLFAMVWPIIGIGIYYLGQGLSYGGKYGGITTLVFGFLNRALLPLGLHHVLDIPLWFSDIGGSLNTNDILYINGTATTNHLYQLAGDGQGTIVTGDINMQIYLTRIIGKSIDLNGAHHIITIQDIINSEKIVNHGATQAFGQYTNFAYIFGQFGLTGAAIGMLLSAPKGEQRKLAASVIVPALIVNIITGTSEPIEFTFLFLAPALYFGFHAVMAGIGGMITTILIYWVPAIAPHVTFSFSYGLLDFFIYGVIPDIRGGGTHCWVLLLLSLGYFPIYFFVFRWAIVKWNIKTPGRDGQTKLFTKADWIKKQSDKKDPSVKQTLMHDKCIEIINAYGGKDNILNIDACLTKLRIQVQDKQKVDEAKLMQLGALGITHPSPQSVYAVFGQEADVIKTTMKEIIAKNDILINQQLGEENVNKEK